MNFSYKSDHGLKQNCQRNAQNHTLTAFLNQAMWHWMRFQRQCPWTKWSSTWLLFKEDDVLEPSKAALGAFSMKKGSLNQAKRHLMPFQRRQCSWTKRSSTSCLFKKYGVLDSALHKFPMKAVSLKQAKRHLTTFQRRRCPWTKQSGTRYVFNKDGVLKPSEVSLHTFLKKKVSLNQAK